ncbi:MAG: hypothetical protein FWH57_06700 [Oscillospiraceae bacterium]|nr:hypothetical protein [Oscillospiraceae bacterium]
MPDKQNESKFMAMLERRGIVRKTGSGENPLEANLNSAPTNEKNQKEEPSKVERANEVVERERVETDFRAIFDQPADEAMKVKHAAQQPVPGMINPSIPVERFGQIEREDPIGTATRAEPTPPKRVEMPRPSPFFNGSDFTDGDVASDGRLSGRPEAAFAQNAQFTPSEPYIPDIPERTPEPPPPESYTDRYLDIEALYEALSMKSKRTDTIYLIEEYLKTLPESLPDESRREIVSRIVAASGFDYDLLMGDGILRVKMLKEYAERFAKHTDDYISARNSEVDELEQQIMKLRRLIENRRDLHKRQFFAIEAEAQRLKDILTFISG